MYIGTNIGQQETAKPVINSNNQRESIASDIGDNSTEKPSQKPYVRDDPEITDKDINKARL